jgi:uncharacterized protein YaaN involved in tellurite resistance
MAFDIAVIDKETTVSNTKVEQLANTIKATDYNSIAKFGANIADNVSKCADKMLQSDATDQINKTQELMTTVNKLMTNFDMKDLEPQPNKTFLDKITNKAKRGLDKVVKKYDTLGKDVEKIYTTMKSYTTDIEVSNKNLGVEFNAQVQYYKDIKEHIAACEQAQNTMETTDDNAIALLSNKLNDLKCAEAITVQNLMMIKLREFNNINLVRKIDNAFIITLPLFKQQLNQAIELKKQSIQAQALSMLDEKTNEMLKQNAQNGVAIAKQVAQMANTSVIKMETIEQTYNTILNGAREISEIQANALKEQQSNSERLKELKGQLNSQTAESV